MGPSGLRPSDVIGGFFIAALAMAGAGIVAMIAHGLEPWAWGRWLALHLIFIGGISQLVLGASQFFAGAFLATDPPSRTLIRSELASWNLGTLFLAVGVPAGSEAAVYAGGALLVASLAAYAGGLIDMRRRSLSTAPWASRWYLTGASFLVVGILAGLLQATGTLWAHGDLLASHMVLNLGGWFGSAIVGTLHTFFPSLTGSGLRHPRLQAPTFAAWTAGIAGLGLGYGFSIEALVQTGWLSLSAAAALLSANLIGSLRSATRPLSLAAMLVGVAQLFLVAGLAVASVEAFGEGSTQTVRSGVVGILLVPGWIGLTVLGSLLQLLALLVHVRNFGTEPPRPRLRRDLAVTVLAVSGVSFVALTRHAGTGAVAPLANGVLVCAYALIGARIAPLASKVLLVARPRL